MTIQISAVIALTRFWVLVAGCSSIWGQQYDSRINQAVKVNLQDSSGNAISLNAGGRVGNWATNGSSQTLIFDINNASGLVNPRGVTALYTSTITPPISGSSLTLTATPLLSPTLAYQILNSSSYGYVGNGWMCPGGAVLFQAAVTNSATPGYGPGAGADNNVWMLVNGGIYKLTNVTANQGNGVLNPICSNDSGSGTYHIVYGYRNCSPGAPGSMTALCPSGLLPYVSTPDCNTAGMSNGKCGWYGDWSLVFEDCTVGATGGPTCVTSSPVNLRALAQNPFQQIAPGTGTGTIGSSSTCVAGSSCVTITSSPSTPFSTTMAGSGITVTDTTHPSITYATSITSVSGSVATLELPFSLTTFTAGDSATFGVVHNVYYEPHWYPTHWGFQAGDTSTGQLYVTSNRHLTWHDSVSTVATFTGATPTVTLTELTPEPATALTYSTTVFNEFGTPSPNYPNGQPFAVYMSDAAHTGTASCDTAVPECSDLYLCTLPGCQHQVPIIWPDFTETYPAYTAVRTSFSPDSTHIAMLLQKSGAAPLFYIWNLAYPTIEVTGHVTAQGHITIK